jgi:ribonuclease I
MKTLLSLITWMLALVFSSFVAANAQAADKPSPQEARQIAEDAYIMAIRWSPWR